MTYEVKIAVDVSKDLKRIPSKIRTQLTQKIRELQKNPLKNTSKLKGHKRFRKLRVGKYQIILEILSKAREVKVLFVGHRSKVYEQIERFL